MNKCSQCSYASFESGNLKKHLKTHTGERTNKCNLCDYASSGSLKNHLKTHSGEKPNKCNLCGYASSVASNLRTHVISIHTREKSYKCNQCDYASSQAVNLKKHLKTHTETNAMNVTFPALIQTLWVNIWKRTVETSWTNLTNVKIYSFRSLKVHHLLQTINLNYDLKKHLPIHRGEKPHQNRFRLTN